MSETCTESWSLREVGYCKRNNGGPFALQSKQAWKEERIPEKFPHLFSMFSLKQFNEVEVEEK